MGFSNDELFLQAIPLVMLGMIQGSDVFWPPDKCNPTKVGHTDYLITLPVNSGSHRIRATLSGDQIAYWAIRSEPVSIEDLPAQVRFDLFNMVFKDIDLPDAIFSFFALAGPIDAPARDMHAQCNLKHQDNVDMNDWLQRMLAVASRGDLLKSMVKQLHEPLGI